MSKPNRLEDPQFAQITSVPAPRPPEESGFVRIPSSRSHTEFGDDLQSKIARSAAGFSTQLLSAITAEKNPLFTGNQSTAANSASLSSSTPTFHSLTADFAEPCLIGTDAQHHRMLHRRLVTLDLMWPIVFNALAKAINTRRKLTLKLPRLNIDLKFSLPKFIGEDQRSQTAIAEIIKGIEQLIQHPVISHKKKSRIVLDMEFLSTYIEGLERLPEPDYDTLHHIEQTFRLSHQKVLFDIGRITIAQNDNE